jgi:hypothetical protein
VFRVYVGRLSRVESLLFVANLKRRSFNSSNFVLGDLQVSRICFGTIKGSIKPIQWTTCFTKNVFWAFEQFFKAVIVQFSFLRVQEYKILVLTSFRESLNEAEAVLHFLGVSRNL